MARTEAFKESPARNPIHLTAATVKIVVNSRMNRLSPSFFIERFRRTVGPVQTLLGIASRHFREELPVLRNLIKAGRPADFLCDILNLIQKADLIPIDFMDDVADIDHPYFDCIPFVPLGLDWDEYDPEQRMFLPCILLNCIFQSSWGEQSFFTETLVEAGYQDLADMEGIAKEVPVDKFIESLKLTGPWKAFPSFMRYALSCTGSNLLDMGYSQYAECSDPPSWNDFDDWVAEWKRFKPVYKQAIEFMRWVQENESLRMYELANLLKEARDVYHRKRKSAKRSASTKSSDA